MPVRPKWKSRQKVAAAAGLLLLLAAIALFFWHRREPSREQRVSVALRQLTQPPGWGDRLHSNIWRKLPQAVLDEFPNLTPIDLRHVRLNALDELAHLAPKSGQAVDTLISLLDNPLLAEKAIKALEAIGPFAHRAIDKLIDVSSRPTVRDPGLEMAALSALVAVAPLDDRVLATLLAKVKPPAPAPWVAASCLERCAHLYDREMQQTLLALSSSDPALRKTLFRAIAKIEPHSSETIAFLVAGLSTNSAPVQHDALNLLIETPRTNALIIAQLQDILRDAAINAPPPAFHPATYAGVPPPPYPIRFGNTLRDQAVRALGKIGPAAASSEPLLRARLSQSDRNFRLECATALFHITGNFTPFEKALPDALQSIDDRARLSAFARLEEIARDNPAAIPLLRFALQNSDKNIRYRSLLALSRFGPAASNAVPDILPLLSDRSYSVRYEATNFLTLLRGATRVGE